MATLIFIDTNIWLDFYRVRGRAADLSLLDRVDGHRDRVITTAQVEMEFKKNRPQVILESHAGLKSPNWSAHQLPAYLARSKQSSGLSTGQKRIDKQLSALRKRTENVFRDPVQYDPVYKVAQRVFRQDSPINLSRDKPERSTIRRLAYKRFALGYPPRKDSDTSVGDAVNWEWIVRCASESGKDVVIVSRDSDYGVQFDGQTYLNDWLRQEFTERVAKTRKVTLTGRLAEGLKLAKIDVTKAEEKSEDAFLKERKVLRFNPDFTKVSATDEWPGDAEGIPRDFFRAITALGSLVARSAQEQTDIEQVDSTEPDGTS
jgi:hypothetical protein